MFVSCPPTASPYGIEIDREEREREGSGVCPPRLSHSVRVLESGSDFGVARSCPFTSARPGGRPFPWIKLCSVSSLVLPYRTKKNRERKEKGEGAACVCPFSAAARASLRVETTLAVVARSFVLSASPGACFVVFLGPRARSYFVCPRRSPVRYKERE